MRALCVTIDLDRDVNIRIPGASAAGSIDRGGGTGPRFSSSEKGLELLAELFDDMGIKATFFAEASTLRKVDAGALSGHEVGIHGADHEDITLIKETDGKRAVLEEAVSAVKDAVGRAPASFRAPYMRTDAETFGLLPEFGISVDSSRYADVSASLMPERAANGVWEMPVPEGTDPRGKKISAYLWPMHESKRRPEDYAELASMMKEGVFVIATHTWHIVESREKGMMSPDEVETNIGNVRNVLEKMMDMGLRPLTLADAKKAAETRCCARSPGRADRPEF